MPGEKHFTGIASRYRSLRTTDVAPVREICDQLPDGSLRGLDAGCGTGRYSELLYAMLGERAPMILVADVNTEMLASLRGLVDGATLYPVRSAAERLPIRAGSLDFVTAFNAVHHFDVTAFAAEAAELLAPHGSVFVYTRTPEMNGRSIWGREFPGFADKEERLSPAPDLCATFERSFDYVATRSFRFARSSTREQLRHQVENRHYSTFALYAPDELDAALDEFLDRLPPVVEWVDENLLVSANNQRLR